MKNQLYPHQQQALEDLRSALKEGHCRIMLQAATGYGKTILACAIVERALERGNRIAFMAPYTTLINQTYDKFVREGIERSDIGVMQADHELSYASRPVQVVSVDTLRARVKKQHKEDLKHNDLAPIPYPKWDVVIIDEAHRKQKFVQQWMSDRPEQVFIGLSATPWSKGLGLYYSALIKSVGMEELIESGFLSSYRVFCPSAPDLSGVKVSSTGEYKEDELAVTMSEDKLVGEIVDNYVRNGKGEPAICFATNRLHADTLSKKFEAAGVVAAYVDGFTSREDRDDIFSKFSKGDIQMIVNVGVLVAGFDGDVRCLILARPVRSAILHVQMIGRALRPAEGKEHALIFDHASNFFRLGFPEQCGLDRLDTTDSGYVEAKAIGEPDPKECKKCGMLRTPGQKSLACLGCGHIPDPTSQLKEKSGDLVEVTDEDRRAAQRAMQSFYSGLLHIQFKRKYKNGWAKINFKKKFGIDPPMYIERTPVPPDEAVVRWEKHQRIKYAKSKRWAARSAS